MRLTLVGTGHVFRIGEIVDEIIQRRGPHVVCVELDPVRLSGLQERARLAAYEEAGDPRAEAIRREHEEATKRMPRLYRFLAKLQERLADQEGVEAGSEMLAAVEAANRLGLPVATIDVDAQALIRRAWGQMRWKERLRFVWAILRGNKGSQVEAELAEYQDDPVAYLARVGEEFPTLKRVLIDERDAHMAKKILELQEAGVKKIQQIAQDQKRRQAEGTVHPPHTDNDPSGDTSAPPTSTEGPTAGQGEGPEHASEEAGTPDEEEELVVVAVVGDGHVPGMLEILQDRLGDPQIESIRVGDLRAGRIPEAMGAQPQETSGDGASVSLQYDVQAVDPPESDPPAN